MDSAQVSEIIKYIWPIIVLQLGIQVFALVDLIRRKNIKYLPKVVWAIIIILGEIVGAVVYLLLGKGKEE
jgi:DMSO reductase anchor subunit